ncbi:hypothetical protein ACIA49_07185 [Kribbella sp. NPDC051587]|uniref:hypothetical protein n=1 Tax=Kribbella sp. NPDC051587 TaxID=3364119 RepID=UPI003793F3BF
MMSVDKDAAVWDARVRLKLAGGGIGKETADEVLAEVAQHCADSGETPRAAFGDPDEFATTVLQERRSPAERAGIDRFGYSRGERRSEVIAQVGLVFVVAGVFLWIAEGLMLSVTVAGGIGFVVLIAAVVRAVYVVHAMRGDGRRTGELVRAWCEALGLGVVAALAFTLWPTTSVGRFPTPVIVAAGFVLLCWAFVRKDNDPAPAGEDGAWLAELSALLVGRHGVPRRRARALIAETEAHLNEAKSSPLQEFGPADQYAVTLADSEPRTRWPWL